MQFGIQDFVVLSLKIKDKLPIQGHLSNGNTLMAAVLYFFAHH